MTIRVDELGLTPYRETLRLQKHLQQKRRADRIEDTLLLTEHPPTITAGAQADSTSDYQTAPSELKKDGFDVVRTRRGGHLAYHGPGQAVAYPIVELQTDVRTFVDRLQAVMVRTLQELGLQASTGKKPGVYVKGSKVGWVGVTFSGRVARHGMALNVDVATEHYQHIIPCNTPGETVTSIREHTTADFEQVRSTVQSTFVDVFEYDQVTPTTVEYPDVERPERRAPNRAEVKPSFLTVRAPGGATHERIRSLIDSKNLNTVCEEASCPNMGECWSSGTATFMLLGDTCTRSCGFCDVKTGSDADVDPMEPARVAKAVEQMGLSYVVLTSVNRDDLPDGGADIWARTIRAVQKTGADVEALVPDFEGDRQDLQTVIEAQPDVLNHNIETVPRLYQAVRPGSHYEQSLQMLQYASTFGIPTKSGLMLGIGERSREVRGVLKDLSEHDVELLTIGQYLRPDETNLPVQRYAHPVEYSRYEQYARTLGFEHAECGPLVRSSYRADQQAKALS